MKRIILILLFIPFVGFSQLSQLTFEFQKGSFQDVLHTELDVNSFSPDMSSSSDDFDFNSTRFVLFYPIYNNVSLGAFYSKNESSGNNSVEFYETSFDEYGMILEYNFYQLSDFTLFANLFTSSIDFNSSRYFQMDSRIPISTIVDETTARGYGFGAKYNFSQNVLLTFSYLMYYVNHDGFDGWDYGTDIDKLNYTSLGLRFQL